MVEELLVFPAARKRGRCRRGPLAAETPGAPVARPAFGTSTIIDGQHDPEPSFPRPMRRRRTSSAARCEGLSAPSQRGGDVFAGDEEQDGQALDLRRAPASAHGVHHVRGQTRAGEVGSLGVASAPAVTAQFGPPWPPWRRAPPPRPGPGSARSPASRSSTRAMRSLG